MDNETLKKLVEGFRGAYGEGREDYSDAYKDAREAKGKGREGTRINHLLGTNPTFVRTRELLGLANDEDVRARSEMGLGLDPDKTRRVGQILGTLGADLTQDHSRGLYWLINAPQALGNIINEEVLARANPDLYKSERIKDENGKDIRTVKVDRDGEPIKNRNYQVALDNNLISESGKRQKHVGTNKGFYQRRKYEPGFVEALGIPAGAAINGGMGLLNPIGGSGGYEAAMPSQDDPTTTSNVLMEIGAKYILGRTGNLLPYAQFSQERPDVAKGEYNAYKAFKYDKGLDLNITDGDFTLPTGILKGTTDGIHGPEIQFMGRSLPLLTTGIPFAAAVAGTTMGVRTKRPIRNGFIGGMAGLAAGGGTGLLLENERQRRNGISNFGNSRAIDPEETQVGF
jgi:hypothetical protein